MDTRSSSSKDNAKGTAAAWVWSAVPLPLWWNFSRSNLRERVPKDFMFLMEGSIVLMVGTDTTLQMDVVLALVLSVCGEKCGGGGGAAAPKVPAERFLL